VLGNPTRSSAKNNGLACDCQGSPYCGDPITISNGNLFEQATDYTTAGQNPNRNQSATAAEGECPDL
jgi:hypothetical protein